MAVFPRGRVRAASQIHSCFRHASSKTQGFQSETIQLALDTYLSELRDRGMGELEEVSSDEEEPHEEEEPREAEEGREGGGEGGTAIEDDGGQPIANVVHAA